MESRHIDVIEMDAASHNSVDDIRQINDAVRYAPVSARTKVYILDEVHMLSGAAFNALLKTLEEPPPHAKFIFATTEIRKVPVTVLSRCQRFDLRRVDAEVLVRHLQGIADKEAITIEPDALALIARAAEGSVRDSLSLLDQAIAHAAGAVRAEDVRQMLGLADRARTIDLFEALMRGDIAAALKELRDQYDTGADPAVALADLAEFTNFVTRVKVVPAVADDVAFSEVERTRGRDFAAKLSMRVLSRTWQMLLKGMSEVQSAGRPIAAAEMVLVRIAYAADLPTPDEAIRALNGGAASAAAPVSGNGGNGGNAGVSAPTASSGPAAQRFDAPRGAPRAALVPRETSSPAPAPATVEAPAKPALALNSFEEMIALAARQRDLTVKTALERDVRLVRFEDGKLEIALEPGAPKTMVHELSRKLQQWTGRRWMVVVSTEEGAPTVRSQADIRQAELERGVAADPFVQQVLARFPGAQIVDVRRSEDAMMAADALPAATEDDGDLPEPMMDDDSSAFGAHGLPDDVDDDF